MAKRQRRSRKPAARKPAVRKPAARKPAASRRARATAPAAASPRSSGAGSGALIAAVAVGLGVLYMMRRPAEAMIGAPGGPGGSGGDAYVNISGTSGSGTSGSGTSGSGTSGSGTSGSGTSGRGTSGSGTSGSGTSGSGTSGALYGSGQVNSFGQLAPTAATVSRLNSDSNFRNVYAFQSLAYSARLTDAAPDGIIGPVTRGIMNLVSQRMGQSFASITPTSIRNFSRWIRSNVTSLRNQPNWLPYETVVRINRESIGYDPDGHTAYELVPIQTGYWT